MTFIEVLRAARELIRNEGSWCQGSDASDINGDWAHPSSDEAIVWCAFGALRSTAGSGMYSAVQLLMSVLSDDGTCTITAYNDSHTHKEVLAKFDEAIG